MYCRFEAIAENIDEWRGNLVGRIKQYASTISDLQSTTNSAIFNSDLNSLSFSSVLARLDHFAERLHQQDHLISDKSVRIQSLISSVSSSRWHLKINLFITEGSIQGIK